MTSGGVPPGPASATAMTKQDKIDFLVKLVLVGAAAALLVTLYNGQVAGRARACAETLLEAQRAGETGSVPDSIEVGSCILQFSVTSPHVGTSRF